MEAISALPPRCQQVYRLRKREELSQREVADRLAISEGNMEKHLSRGVEGLMDLFGRDVHGSAPKPQSIDEAVQKHVRTRK
ncbi:RNA polymerase sigma factor [Sphingobium aquiterrae]|uniref:RNA polymerase sigma factor n=1 Tax=Sphingobium aquiterrae TaxID=2038656 RepID=UPI003AFA5695